MSDTTSNINFVIYIDSSLAELSRKKKLYYSAVHGYTYDLTKEGKRKLAKDVPTSSGYYTGNNQKANTVVDVQDILTVFNPGVKTELSALLGSFLLILKEFVKDDSPYKNLCVITRHRELQQLSDLKKKDLNKEKLKIGNFSVLENEKALVLEVLGLLEQMKGFETPKLILYDFSASAEGGLGNRLCAKEMDTCLVETKWSCDPAPLLSLVSRKEYENPPTDFNRIVSASRWYFESNDDENFFSLKDGYRCYNFGKVEPDKNYYGKMTPDVTYSRLYSREPITLLDRMYKFTNKKIKNPNHYLLAGDLRIVTGKDTCRLLDTIPGFIEDENLVSPITRQGKKPILVEVINPVMLTFRVREILDGLDIIYECFKDRDENNTKGHTKFYDITDELFVVEENKKQVKRIKLRPEFTQNVSVHYTNVEHRMAKKLVRIMLSIGYDLPERNSLNTVTDVDVKVWVAADTTNDKGVRYCTIIETKDYLYIHSSSGANLRVLSLSELK